MELGRGHTHINAQTPRLQALGAANEQKGAEAAEAARLSAALGHSSEEVGGVGACVCVCAYVCGFVCVSVQV